MKKLGKYEIRRELGRGAMGVVYEAFDPQIERTVAIKTILKSAIQEREAEEIFSRFRHEARAAGRLSHPKIVSIYEYGEDDDLAFIVMELIRGKELKEYFDQGDRFAIRDGIRIVLQILDALDYSHAHGVVHRDIKPANIMITDDGQIKIADFGIAKIDSSCLTQVGVVLGTPAYMSPEQFLGNEVDHRTDIYATGVILYQFLTGVRPFTGSVITIMHQAINQEAVPPSQLNPEVSKQIDDVVKKAMAKRTEERFQSATEFMEALKAAAQTLLIPGSLKIAPDATLISADESFAAEETLLLPDNASGVVAAVEGATTRLLEISSALAQEAAAQARSAQEAQARTALEEKKRSGAQQAALERLQVQKALAEAETKRQREAAKAALLARRLAEIKNKEEKAKAAEALKREKEAAEQVRRSKELAAFLSDHNRKFAEFVAAREAALEAKRKAEAEEELRQESENP